MFYKKDEHSGDPELEDPGLCDALPGGEAGLCWGVPQALLNTLRRKRHHLLYPSMSIFHFTAQTQGSPLLLKSPLQLLTAHHSHISAINKHMLEYLRRFFL